MKRGSLLKRVSTREPRGRLSGGAKEKEEKYSFSCPVEKYQAVNTPTKAPLGGKNRKPEKGGSLLQRFVGRRKKNQEAPPAQAFLQSPDPNPSKRFGNLTPITVDTDHGDEIEVPISIPCERVPSYAETTQTHEISDFSAQMEDVIKEDDKKGHARSFKRASSGKSTSARMILDTSAIPFGNSRSARNARKTGNESLGDSKPHQPRRGFLPPLLAEGEESVGESSCSGITMDFTYGDEVNTPTRLPPVGRLGEGVPPKNAPDSRFPPSYITMDGLDGLDRPSFGDF